MQADKPTECVSCNTFDVGSILDNSEREAKVSQVYATEEEAQQALQRLTQKARDIESDECQISSEIKAVDGGYQLDAVFSFSCQAEVIIFQLGIR